MTYRRKSPDEELGDLVEWHYDPSRLGEPKMQTVMDLHKQGVTETWRERIKRMLESLHTTCATCSMCSLGRKACHDRDEIFDPHVFSNMNPSRWLLTAQNPGFNEVLQGEPLVGDAGQTFNKEIRKHDLDRSEFYISNVCRCYTVGNATPDSESTNACEPFLRMEVGLLRPILVITLGAVAFNTFCPRLQMTDNVNKIIFSEKFNVQVYPVYHPSGRNMSLAYRKKSFEEGIESLCALIKAYRVKHIADNSLLSGA